MLSIETNSKSLSAFQSKALFFAARENANEETDIKRLFAKLEVIAEDLNDAKWLKMEGKDEIVITHYSDGTTLNIIELHPQN